MSVINTYAKGQYGTITTIVDSPTNQTDKPVSYYAGGGHGNQNRCYSVGTDPCQKPF